MNGDETRLLSIDEATAPGAPPRLGVRCVGETYFGEASAEDSASPRAVLSDEQGPIRRKRLVVLGGIGGASAGLALAVCLGSTSMASPPPDSSPAPLLVPPARPGQELEAAGTGEIEVSDAAASEVAARGARALARGDCGAALEAYRTIALRDDAFAVLAARLALECSTDAGEP